MLAAEALWQRLDASAETREFYAPYLAALPSPPAVAAGGGGGGGGGKTTTPTPLTTTDFFTEEELGLLGWAPIQVRNGRWEGGWVDSVDSVDCLLA